MLEMLSAFAKSPYFAPMLYYLTTLFGAVAMYVFALNKGFEGAVPFLRRMLPGKRKVYYDRLDFFVTTIAGSVVGTICFAPQSSLQALAAGFGWVGAMNVLMTPKSEATGQANDSQEQIPQGPAASLDAPAATTLANPAEGEKRHG